MDLTNNSKCKKTNCDNTKDKVEQGEKGPPTERTKCLAPAVPPVLKNVGKLAAGVAGMSSGSATEDTEEEPTCHACRSYNQTQRKQNNIVGCPETCNDLVRKPKCSAISSNTYINCNDCCIHYENNCDNYSTLNTDCNIKKTLNCTNFQSIKYTDLIDKDEIVYSCIDNTNTQKYDEYTCPSSKCNNTKKSEGCSFFSNGFHNTNNNNQFGNKSNDLYQFEAGTSGINSYKNNVTSNICSKKIATNNCLEYQEKTNILKNTPSGVDISKNAIPSNNIDLFDSSNGIIINQHTFKFQTGNYDGNEDNFVIHTKSAPNTFANNFDLFSNQSMNNSGYNNDKSNLQSVDLFNKPNYLNQNEVSINAISIDSSKSAPLFATDKTSHVVFDENRKTSETIGTLDFKSISNLPELTESDEIKKNIKYNPFFIRKSMIGINNCKCNVLIQNGKNGTHGKTCKIYATSLGLKTCNHSGNPRNKTALQPGHSLMDWIRLSHSGQDLTGVGPKAGTLSVSPKQLAEHNKESDAWIAIRGKVYNITAYFDFHPGGKEELMKGAGQDATQMFNAVHPWVNYESILQKCLVGRLTSAEIDEETFSLFYGRSNQTIKVPHNFRFNVTSSVKNTNGGMSDDNMIKPKFDWVQQLDNITTIFYTKPFSNPQVQVTAPTKANELDIILIYNNFIFKNHLHFSNNIHWPCTVNINCDTGKVEINFRKIESKIWDNYGTLSQENEDVPEDYEYEKVKYIVLNNVEENHNTRLMAFQRIDGVKQTIPIGFHLKVYGTIDDIELIRFYTAVPCSFMRKYSENYEAYRGDVCLLIKSYPKGLLSPTICASVKGDTFELSPPLGTLDLEKISCRRGYLILAAGTGIAPMLGIMKLILETTKVKCEKLYLIYFNQTEDDILLRTHFENLVNSDERVVVKHVLSNPSKTWTGLSGHIDANLLKTTIDEECSDTQLFPVDIFSLICGPLVFANLAKSLLVDIGYTDDNIHLFGS